MVVKRNWKVWVWREIYYYEKRGFDRAITILTDAGHLLAIGCFATGNLGWVVGAVIDIVEGKRELVGTARVGPCLLVHRIPKVYLHRRVCWSGCRWCWKFGETCACA